MLARMEAEGASQDRGIPYVASADGDSSVSELTFHVVSKFQSGETLALRTTGASIQKQPTKKQRSEVD